MATVESLDMRKRLCCGSMERGLHSSRNVVQKLLKIPKALMEALTMHFIMQCFKKQKKGLFG